MNEDLWNLAKFSLAFILISYVVMGVFSHLPILKNDYYISNLNTVFNANSHTIKENIQFHVNEERFHELFKDYYGSPEDIISVSCPKDFNSYQRSSSEGYELGCKSPTTIKKGNYNIDITYSPKDINWNHIKWVSFNNVYRKIMSFTSNGAIVYGSSFNGEPIVAFYPKADVFDILYMMFIKITYYDMFLVPFLFVILFIIIYYKYGREFDIDGIPDVYHSPPNKKRYAFDVVLAFRDPPTKESITNKIKPILSSILIEAVVSGAITMTDKKITIKDLSKLPENIRDVITNLAAIKNIKQIDYSDYLEIVTSLKFYFDTGLNFHSIYNNNGESKLSLSLIIIIVVSMILLFIPLFGILPVVGKVLAITNLNVFYESIIGLSLVPVLGKHIFGKYKTVDVYKEKLLWDSFGHLLRNESLLKKYGPKDKNMWGRWLAYAYAFDVPKKILNNIIKKNINTNSYYISSAYLSTAGMKFSNFRSRSSGGGSSFSSGGGFGGGFSGGGSFGAR